MIRIALLVVALAPVAFANETPPPVAPAEPPSNERSIEAADPLETAREAARFAAHLAAQGDHYRAITEYKRALWFGAEAPEAPRWAMAIGEAYRLGEQFEAAAEQYEAVAERHPQVQAEALLGAAKSWQGAKKYESAIERARESARAYGEGTDGARQAHYVEGWSLLLATDLDTSERDVEAAEAFRRARGEGRLGEGVDQLLAVMPQLESLPSKSPLAAGMLGLVPGLGHFYLGEVTTGVSALVWNGLFGWALFEAVRAKNYSLAVVLGLFEAMWYGGSITGAISGAHRYNRDARVNAMEDLGRLSAPGLLDEIVARPGH